MTAKKIILYVVLLVVAANLALLVLVLTGTKASIPAAPPVPKPNGYDDFVRAEKLVPTTADAYKTMTPGQLRAAVAANSPALSLVRIGLTRECLVPLDDIKWRREEHFAELNNFKSLILAFAADASLADLEHRTNDAAEIWLDVIRFSHAVCRGGPLLDATMGRSGEVFGLSHLTIMLNDLNANICAHVAKSLEEIDRQSESREQVMNQEKTYNGKLTFRQSLSRLVHFRRLRSFEQDLENKFNEQTKLRRQTMLAFATRAYTLQKGKSPANPNDLVPTYLKAVPQIPTTLTNSDAKP